MCYPRSSTFISIDHETFSHAGQLIAFDGSPLSERALTYAIETFPDASITSIYVINPLDSVIDVEAGGLPELRR